MNRYNDPGGADHISLYVHIPFDPCTGRLASRQYYGFTVRQGTLNDAYLYDAATGNLNPWVSYTLSPISGWHRYKVTKVGNTYTYYIDNVQVFSRTITSPYSGGYVAISGGQGFTGSGTAPRIEFDNFRLTAVIIVGVGDPGNTLPVEYELSQNYPNPFNPTTSIDFSLPKESNVRVTIYDALGREIDNLVNDRIQAGVYRTTWDPRTSDGKPVSSGLYFYRLIAAPLDGSEPFVQTRKMLLLR